MRVARKRGRVRQRLRCFSGFFLEEFLHSSRSQLLKSSHAHAAYINARAAYVNGHAAYVNEHAACVYTHATYAITHAVWDESNTTPGN